MFLSRLNGNVVGPRGLHLTALLMGWMLVGWQLSSFVGSSTSDVRADVILLTNGSRLNGKVLRRPNDESNNYVVELRKGVRVRLSAREVGRIEQLTSLQKRYAELLPDMPDSAHGHFEMARWCHKHELKDLKQLHLNYVLRHDPDHVETHRMLGHSLKQGRWAEAKDHMKSQGYARHQGNLRLPQQIELEKQKKSIELAQKKWRGDIQRWRRWLRGRQAETGREQIRAINDPLAIPGLREVLQKESDPNVRQLYIDVLARFDEPAADGALIHAAIHDDELELRIRCLDYLRQRGSAMAVDSFVRSLRSKDNRIVRRAGVALGRLGDEQAVRPLINALVTTHEYIEKPQGNIRTSFGGTSDGSTGFNGLSAGGGPKKVKRQHENKAVLDALITITKQNFRFSAADWHRWYVQQNSLPADINLRRDL